MAARLAFAVATDVDPDILLVDEALSVGDEKFQRKCHERMKGFHDRGKTMMLVSHSLSQIRDNCDRALWLHHGRVVAGRRRGLGDRGISPVVVGGDGRGGSGER